MPDPGAVRDAATVILVRDAADDPKVLMGRRSPTAVFMPSAFVFPGGAVDRADARVELAEPLPQACAAALRAGRPGVSPETLALAALRELFEETGLIIGSAGPWPRPPAPWHGFAACGYRPTGAPLSYVFRAVTPPGHPRRFDARFFLADAASVAGDCADFSRASDELSDLAWIPLSRVPMLDTAFITQAVLADIAGRLPSLSAPAEVPFFKNDDEARRILQSDRARHPRSR